MKPRSTPRPAVIELPFIAKPRVRGRGDELFATIAAGSMFHVQCMRAWLARAAQRLHPNVLAAALANELARIAWTALAQERTYESRVTKVA
jgi:hypothetical protein